MPPRTALSDALRKSTLAVRCARLGTGFFVGPRLLVTSAHVVADTVRAIAIDGDARLALEVVEAAAGPDLALLRIVEEVAHPFVCLAPAIEHGDALHTYGHPVGDYHSGDSAAMQYSGESVRARSARLLKANGDPLRPGMSGAPVLNWRTGGVCGAVRLGDDATARLTPAAEILSAFPEVAAHHRTGTANVEWLELLDDEQLRAGGWAFAGPRMRAYLAAARQAAGRHPYAVSIPDAPPLATVYLRQRASQANRDANSDEIIDLPGPSTVGGDESTNDDWIGLDALFRRHRNVLIFGRPGAGKSSLLRYVVDIAAAQIERHGVPLFVPVYLTATALMARRPFPEILADAAGYDLAPWLDEAITADWFRQEPLAGTPWLVVIDGVDEILDPQQRWLALETIAQRLIGSHFRFLVASRPLPDAELQRLERDRATALEILPFEAKQLRELSGGWFTALRLDQPRAMAARFMHELGRSRISHLARIPLLATMLCVVFAKNPDRGIPTSRSALYHDFVELLLSKQHEHVNIYDSLGAQVRRFGPMAEEAVIKLLDGAFSLIERLALDRQRQARLSLAKRAVELSESLRPPQVPQRRWAEIVSEMLRQSGLLVERRTEMAFIHQTVEEYLAARQQARSTRAGSATKQLAEMRRQGRSQSFLLFFAAELQRHGTKLADLAADLLNRGRPEDVMFVAAMVRDGINLPASCVDLATWRLRILTEARSIREGLRVEAAHELAYLDPQQGIGPLQRISRGTRSSGYDRIQAARRIADIDLHGGIEELGALTRDPSLAVEHRIVATQQLADLDRDEGMAAYRYIAANASMPGQSRVDLVDSIRKIDEQTAFDAFRAMALDSALPTEFRELAVERLYGYDMEYDMDTVPAVVAEMTSNPQQSAEQYAECIALIHRYAESRFAETMCKVALDPAAPPERRLGAAGQIKNTRKATSLLTRLAKDPSLDGFARADAAAALAKRAPTRARALLAALADDQNLDSYAQAWVTRRLELLDAGHPTDQGIVHTFTHPRDQTRRSAQAHQTKIHDLGLARVIYRRREP